MPEQHGVGEVHGRVSGPARSATAAAQAPQPVVGGKTDRDGAVRPLDHRAADQAGLLHQQRAGSGCVWRAGLGVTRGQEPAITQLTQTDNIVPYILTVILVGLGAFVGFVLCFIPGIIWLIFTAYAPLLALDKGMDPIEAIQTSINWVKDNFGQVFVILLVSYLIYMAGFCLCGVGLLVSAPVALVAIIYSYRALTNEPVVP